MQQNLLGLHAKQSSWALGTLCTSCGGSCGETAGRLLQTVFGNFLHQECSSKLRASETHDSSTSQQADHLDGTFLLGSASIRQRSSVRRAWEPKVFFLEARPDVGHVSSLGSDPGNQDRQLKYNARFPACHYTSEISSPTLSVRHRQWFQHPSSPGGCRWRQRYTVEEVALLLRPHHNQNKAGAGQIVHRKCSGE